MRTDRLALAGVLVVLGCLLAEAARETGAASPLEEKQSHDTPSLRAVELALGEVVATDGEPALGDSALFFSPERDAAALQDLSCETFGAWQTVRRTTRLYCGNVYRVEYQNVQLREISAQLRFVINSTVDLYLSVHRAPSNVSPQNFQRVTDDCVLEDAPGFGVPTYYSCPLPTPLTLEPGYDYAIGVSWGVAIGGENRVEYAYDNEPYPQDFLHGQVMKRVMYINVTPPMPDDVQFGLSASVGACSLELCFQPVLGACCVPPDSPGGAGRCVMKYPRDCTDPRGYFHGEQVPCEDALCGFGACCFPCGECDDSYARKACESSELGGTWTGANVTCPEAPAESTDLCPVVTGACCTGSECSEICIDQCEQNEGTYLGDHTTCFPNECAGACCIPNSGCTDLTPGVCSLLGGSFVGLGTTCAALPREDECGGACCARLFGDPICFDVAERRECTNQPPDLTHTCYLGDAAVCDPEQTPDYCAGPLGCTACCYPDGSCLVSEPDACRRAMGFVTDATTCLGMTCSTSCCFAATEEDPSGCKMTPTPDDCTAGGGQPWPLPAGSCVPDPCEAITGACCFTGGFGDYDGNGDVNLADYEYWPSCATGPGAGPVAPGCGAFDYQTDADVDLADFARFQEDFGGSTDAGCTPDTEPPACSVAGGRFVEGDCTACPAEPMGACCRPNGTCTDLVTVDECRTLGGIPEAGDFYPGKDCEFGEVDCPPLGACCTREGVCLPDKLASDCAASGGSFAGEGVQCQPDSCPTGVCCFDFDCEEITRAACLAEAGTYQGDGTDCQQIVCPNVEGACCLGGGDCEDILSLDCQDAGGSYQGPYTTCADGLCAAGACCLPGDTCTAQLGSSQCAEQGGEFFEGASCDEPGICHPTRACCNAGGCRIEAEVNCAGTGDVYQDDGTQCDGLCTLGACCHLDGTCDDTVVASQCTGSTDVFHPNRLCSNVCIARGACCLPGQPCQTFPRQYCENNQGTYEGDGLECRENLCVVGACCLADETCDDGITRQECERSGGVYTDPDTVCDGLDCARGRCCSVAGECTDGVTAFECAAPDDLFLPGATCADDPPCVPRGACCQQDGSGPCQMLSQPDCLGNLGQYHGHTTPCTPSPCTLGQVESSDPPDCTIDARQPTDTDAVEVYGWRTIELTFDGDASGLTADDFTVDVLPAPCDPPCEVPSIVNLAPAGNTAMLELNPPIPAGWWTCITHVDSQTGPCLGFLPGDVDGSGTAEGADIAYLSACLDGTEQCELWQCDLDQSGLCAPDDILRCIDLLNGAEPFDPWLDRSLPFCPNGQP